ncbi:MAG: helix-turn-helix domain-containing protein [Planctomycetota bacterium]|nr:helix-turn-helix domain-containing protein [Planctomycetota bacterium]
MTTTTTTTTATEGPREYLSINEVCARYAISRSTFYRMLADPRSGLRGVVVRIPPPRGRIRVSLPAFEAWLARRQRA